MGGRRTAPFRGARRRRAHSLVRPCRARARLHAVGRQPAGGPVALTAAGRLLLRHADAIVAQLDAARADMDAFAEGAAGPLRVGIFQSVGARLLPRLRRRFREEYPRVEVRVREEPDAADLLRLLEHGELDLTFADLPLPD